MIRALVWAVLAVACAAIAGPAFAAPAKGAAAPLSLALPADSASLVRTSLVLGLLALLPALVICMTSFVRIVIVLSMIRHALGMPETPPNIVLVTLALFMTTLTMGGALSQVATNGVQPFISGEASLDVALERGSRPLREFMLRQVHDQDLKAIYAVARQPLPARAADVSMVQLVPAFMLNELRIAFTIGFVILLPFLLIDLVVSAILLSLGMLMVPPATISLPLKILMLVLINGWTLILEGLVGSFR